jgi:hypothetical protein
MMYAIDLVLHKAYSLAPQDNFQAGSQESARSSLLPTIHLLLLESKWVRKAEVTRKLQIVRISV